MHSLSLDVFKDENIPKDNILPTTDFMTDVLETIPPLGKDGPWLVGGTVRRVMNDQLADTDFDIMFKDPAQFDDFCGEMRERGAETKHESPQQVTFDHLGYEIQAIRAVYSPTLRQTLEGFDFTLCQFGFDGTDLIWSDTSMDDVRANKLVFTQTNDPVATMRRMFKYANQGFHMDSAEIARFLKAMLKQEVAIENAKEKWTSGQITAAPSFHSGGPITPPFPELTLPLWGPQSRFGEVGSGTSREVVVSRRQYDELRKLIEVKQEHEFMDLYSWGSPFPTKVRIK